MKAKYDQIELNVLAGHIWLDENITADESIEKAKKIIKNKGGNFNGHERD